MHFQKYFVKSFNIITLLHITFTKVSAKSRSHSMKQFELLYCTPLKKYLVKSIHFMRIDFTKVLSKLNPSSAIRRTFLGKVEMNNFQTNKQITYYFALTIELAYPLLFCNVSNAKHTFRNVPSVVDVVFFSSYPNIITK